MTRDSDGGRGGGPGHWHSAPADKMVEAAEGNIVKLRITSDIDEIDEHKGTFVAEGWITFECKVREYPDGPISRDHNDILNGSIIPFMPTSLFSNSLEHLESDSTYEVKDNIIRGYIGYKSTFPLFFEYSSMPFDKNLLMIKLIQNPAFVRSWGEVVFEHLPVRKNIAEIENDWFWAHFDGEDPNDESFFGLNSALTGLWTPRPPTIDFDNLEFLMPVGRIPLIACINIIIPLFCVVSLAGTAYAFDLSDLPDRLTVVLTMLLTAIAFRLAINESLPVIDHLTLLDKYILSAYLLLSLVATQMTITFRLHKTRAATNHHLACAAGPGHCAASATAAAAASAAKEWPAVADDDDSLRRIEAVGTPPASPSRPARGCR
jgi:hypothetical protein